MRDSPPPTQGCSEPTFVSRGRRCESRHRSRVESTWMATYTPPTLSALTDSVGSVNAPFNRATSPHSSLSHTGSHRSRTPSVEGPRLSFSNLSRGELPSIVIPENRDRRRILLGTYAVLFTRYCIATFLSAFFGSDTTAWGMKGTWNGLIFAGYPLGMALTSLFAPQVCLR